MHSNKSIRINWPLNARISFISENCWIDNCEGLVRRTELFREHIGHRTIGPSSVGILVRCALKIFLKFVWNDVGSIILISRLIIQAETYSHRLRLLVGAVHKGLRVVTGVGGQVIAPVYKQYRVEELDLTGQNVVPTAQLRTVFPLHTVRNSAGLDADEAGDQHHRHRGNLQRNCHRFCWLKIAA